MKNIVVSVLLAFVQLPNDRLANMYLFVFSIIVYLMFSIYYIWYYISFCISVI